MTFFRKKKKINRKLFFVQPDLVKDDFFLISYPRSGSTWLRTILYYILTENEELKSIKDLDEYLPDIHNNLSYLGNYSFPRIIKSHRPYQFRHQNWNSELYSKVIYLCRHPIDVNRSFAHYLCKGKINKEKYLQFYKQLAYGMIAPGLWQYHYLGWYRSTKFNSQLLYVKYEDLENNTKSEIQRILKFIDFHASNILIDRAIELSSLSNMQSLSNSIEQNLGVKNFVRFSKKRSLNFNIPSELTDIVYKNNKMIIDKLY